MPGGYNASGDRVTTLVDGTDLNTMWAEFQQVGRVLSEQQDTLRDYITFGTVLAGEEVVPPGSGAAFEEATEYGEPTGAHLSAESVVFGSDFAWKDLALRFTWLRLATATRQEVEAVISEAVNADHRQTFNKVMQSMFGNVNGTNAEGLTVRALFNNDGQVPPPSGGTVFDGTHNHYLTSGAATIDGQDLADGIDHVAHHGYPGQLLVLAHPQEMKRIRGFRAGVGAPASPYDFIPAKGAPAFLSADEIIGDRAPERLGRIKLEGSFGPAWVAEHPLIPKGYILTLSTDGPNSQYNPVSFRQHPNPALQGLRLVKGRTPNYPLIDSFYSRGFGTGVRHRGAAAVMQITANANYTAPSNFLAA